MTTKCKDIVIDIETLGTRPGSIILTIGAACLTGKYFYSRVQLVSSITDTSLTLDLDTLEWWRKQDSGIREEALDGFMCLSDVLRNFSEYITAEREGADSIRVWGNGANFDITLLEEAYRECKLPIPWNYKEVMCYRTLRNLFPQITCPQNIKPHHALEDASVEAHHLQELLYYVNKSTTALQESEMFKSCSTKPVEK